MIFNQAKGPIRDASELAGELPPVKGKRLDEVPRVKERVLAVELLFITKVETYLFTVGCHLLVVRDLPRFTAFTITK
jgi:hypothetical protein